MSIQTFNSQNFTSSTEPDYYDYIIVDEFHHAAADSYQKLLSYYKPKILLGLTATPERMDGQSILTYFNDRIAAEIRLPEAIERKLLSPFQYFGVTDYADLSGLKWTSGRYDTRERFLNIYPVILCKVFMIPLYLFRHVVLLSDAGEGSSGYSNPLYVKLNSGGIC